MLLMLVCFVWLHRQHLLEAVTQLQVQVHVEADSERAMAATAASSAQAASHDPAFAPVNGYTTETLLKDKRFKVRI